MLSHLLPQRQPAPVRFLAQLLVVGEVRVREENRDHLLAQPVPQAQAPTPTHMARAAAILEERGARDLALPSQLGNRHVLMFIDAQMEVPRPHVHGEVAVEHGNFLRRLGELNLERTNRSGVSYRRVMGSFFTEIERCLRLGVALDLLWDLDGMKLDGYREVVRVREDGRVEVITNGLRTVRPRPRVPAGPDGPLPGLSVELADAGERGPRTITARARITENASPVYYTTGTDRNGVYHNARVLWELFGPEEEDYRALLPAGANPQTTFDGNSATVELKFRVEQAGHYRLRAATTDLAGRSTVVWKEFAVRQ